MITVVLTSCGRFNLLCRTLDSFAKFNTFPVKEIIVVEDSGLEVMRDKITERYPDVKLLFNETKLGQVKSIDRGYAEVKTKYCFHLEEDWEFYRSGFIEKSLDILEHNEKILQVWLRELYDTNTHPIEHEVYTSDSAKFHLVACGALGGLWHGFTWNPGLRRLSDYKLIGKYSDYILDPNFNAQTECIIGQQYFDKGFRSAILTEGYVKHIGYGERA